MLPLGSTNAFIFPYLEKWSNLTNILQMGWNHQPAGLFASLVKKAVFFLDECC